MSETYVIYTLPSCPKCRILKDKMKKSGISFIENSNEQEMREKGMSSVPMVEKGDGILLDFSSMIKYLNSRGG